jgi:hypothetical protein
VVLAFIGVFIGIFLATMVFQKIVQRHMKVLWLKEEVKKYRIVDFYGREVIMILVFLVLSIIPICLLMKTMTMVHKQGDLVAHVDGSRAHYEAGGVAMSPIMPSGAPPDRVSLLPTAPELDSSYHAGTLIQHTHTHTHPQTLTLAPPLFHMLQLWLSVLTPTFYRCPK